jgi:hypothetical protein
MKKFDNGKELNKENQNAKKKHVSFSIFKAETLEEMEALRKEREREFNNLIFSKTRYNESFKNVNSL